MYLKSLLLALCVPAVFAKTQYMGMNIAGLDFGCDIYGNCPIADARVPGDATEQITHFTEDDEMNIFRFPVTWQYLVKDNIGGTMDATNFATYDKLFSLCLATDSLCVIDLHNSGYVNGSLIGQGGPTDAQFADLWAQLATKYADNSKVLFGIMNEPHDLDVDIWATTVQAAVTAVRKAGATSQMILLPPSNFQSAATLVSGGSGKALMAITNPDGSTDNLIFDLHQYLDINNSGSHTTCTTNNIGGFTTAADFLRANNRLGMITETGAGNDSSCFIDFCAQNTFLNENSDVFLGYIAWAAGAFSSSDYLLTLTPMAVDGVYVDQPLAASCVVAPWRGTATASVKVTSSHSSSTSTSASSTGTSKVSTTTKSSSSSMTTSKSTSAASRTASSTAETTGVSTTSTATQTQATTVKSTTQDSGATALVSLSTGLFAGGLILAVFL